MDFDDPEPFLRLLSDDQLSNLQQCTTAEWLRRHPHTGMSASPYQPKKSGKPPKPKGRRHWQWSK